jgi:hypothetical protein
MVQREARIGFHVIFEHNNLMRFAHGMFRYAPAVVR